MSQEVYAITNLEGYADEIRKAAGDFISESNKDDLDAYISIGQIINLVHEHCLGFDEEDRPILDEDTNEFIFESTIDWIHNVGLAKLASQGLVECAWDDDTNEMIFWSKKDKKKNGTKHKKSTDN